MHEPVGYLPAAGELRFAAALVAAGVTSLDLPALCPAVAAAVLLPYRFGWDTSYRMSWLSSAPRANMSMDLLCTALHHLLWYSSISLNGRRSDEEKWVMRRRWYARMDSTCAAVQLRRSESSTQSSSASSSPLMVAY